MLRKNYYKVSPPPGRFFLIGIVYPKPFFKEKKLNKGYLLHLLRILSIFGAIYFLLKLIGTI